MTEAEIERRVVSYCRWKNLITYKFSSPAHRGVPDRIIIAPNQVLLLELKQYGKKPTPLQLREIDRINTMSGPNLWAGWTAGWDDTRRVIDDLETYFFIDDPRAPLP
jgi:hypothetical protein